MDTKTGGASYNPYLRCAPGYVGLGEESAKWKLCVVWITMVCLLKQGELGRYTGV